MSSCAHKKERKTTFGPPVSPEIFALKWGRKFDDLHLQGQTIFSDRMELPASDQNIWLTAMVGFAVKLLASVLWTQHEAKSIGLIIDAHSQPQDKVWGSVDGSKVLLGCILEKFQGAKNGELLYDLVPWNEVPLSFRRKINGFVVTMEDMKTNGHLTADHARLR